MAKKPNILMIFGDDIGLHNLSCYTDGLMLPKTPNIDRIAKEGMKFIQAYAEASCTAGRAAFITGQYPIRVGLSTIGMPGADEGISELDPTLAEILKPEGYVCGQFGKNHLGDLDKFLPTVHGFDEFFGNLYHLNAEEEPFYTDYPKDMPEALRPRGVLHAWAQPDGTQKVEDTGPLSPKRMETIDDEVREGMFNFLEKAVKNDKPFFIWHNTTAMHVWSHVDPEWHGKTQLGYVSDRFAKHDWDIGQILDKLDELGVADNTIVIYTTDNGPETMTWPDGGITPFRSEKGTSWEGGFRVPSMVRWPGVVKPGSIGEGIFAMEDWFPTLCAAAGVPDIVNKLLQGYKAGNKTYKVHLDGYDQKEMLKGGESARHEFIYWTEADLEAVRINDYKIHFLEEMEGWVGGKTKVTWPVVVNLRTDPYEKAQTESGMYLKWYGDHIWTFVPVQQAVMKHLMSFAEFPMRNPPHTLNVDAIMKSMQNKLAGGPGRGGTKV